MLRIIDKVMGIHITNKFGQFMSGAFRTIDDEGIIADHMLLYLNLSCSPCNLRINSACFTSDIFGDSRCDCNWQLLFAMQYIQKQKQGILLYHLHHEGRANGIVAKLRSFDSAERLGDGGAQAYRSLGLPADGRKFQSTKLILRDIGIQEVNLISNSLDKQKILEQAGIRVASRISVVSPDPTLNAYYRWKRKDFEHHV